MHLFSDSYSVPTHICVNLCTCINFHHSLCTPGCLRDCLTLCFHLLCALWGPMRVLCCHQQVVVHVCVFTVHQSMKACTRCSHASFTATSPLCVVHRGERPAVSGADECKLYGLCTLWAWDCTLHVACNLNPSTQHHKVRVSSFSLLKRNKKRGAKICLYVSIKSKCKDVMQIQRCTANAAESSRETQCKQRQGSSACSTTTHNG